MATSKTLAPTKVTISIPSMTDAPNASVLANCADKEADAINALNSQLANGIVKCGSKTITIPAWSTGNPQSITVDFTDDIPAGRSIYCVLGSIGPTQLPYINNAGVVKTWIRNLTDNDKKVVIYSTDGDGWSNKTFYYALVLK